MFSKIVLHKKNANATMTTTPSDNVATFDGETQRLGDIATFSTLSGESSKKQKAAPSQKNQFIAYLINEKAFSLQSAKACGAALDLLCSFEGGGFDATEQNVARALKTIHIKKYFPLFNQKCNCSAIDALRLFLQFLKETGGTYLHSAKASQENGSPKSFDSSTPLIDGSKQKADFRLLIKNAYGTTDEKLNEYCSALKDVFDAVGLDVYSQKESTIDYIIKIIEETYYYTHSPRAKQIAIITALSRYKIFLRMQANIVNSQNQDAHATSKNKAEGNGGAKSTRSIDGANSASGAISAKGAGGAISTRDISGASGVRDTRDTGGVSGLNSASNESGAVGEKSFDAGDFAEGEDSEEIKNATQRQRFEAWEVEVVGLAGATAMMNGAALIYLEQKTGWKIYDTDAQNIKNIIENLPKRSDYDNIRQKYGMELFRTLTRFLQFLNETGGLYTLKAIVRRQYKSKEDAKSKRNWRPNIEYGQVAFTQKQTNGTQGFVSGALSNEGGGGAFAQGGKLTEKNDFSNIKREGAQRAKRTRSSVALKAWSAQRRGFVLWTVEAEGLATLTARMNDNAITYLEAMTGWKIHDADAQSVKFIIKELPKRSDYGVISQKYGSIIFPVLKRLLRFLEETSGVYEGKELTIEEVLSQSHSASGNRRRASRITEDSPEKKKFECWLLDNNFSFSTARTISDAIYALEKMTGENIYGKATDEVQALSDGLQNRIDYNEIKKAWHGYLITSLARYADFLWQTGGSYEASSEALETLEHLKSERLNSYVTKDTTRRQGALSEKDTQAQTAFVEWLFETQGYSRSTAKCMKSAIKRLEGLTGEKLFGAKLIDVEALSQMLPEYENYEEIRTAWHNDYLLLAFSYFLDFMRETSGVYEAKGVVSEKVVHKRRKRADNAFGLGGAYNKGSTQSIGGQNSSAQNGYSQLELFKEGYSEEERAWCKEILEKYFPSGYLLGDEIDEMNYIALYKKLSGAALDGEGEELRALRLIQAVGVNCGGRVYYLENLLEPQTKARILLFIKETLENSCASVSFDVIEKKFESDLQYSILSDKNILKAYLESVGEEDYYCTGKDIRRRGGSTKSLFQSIKDAIKQIGQTATIDEICKILPGKKWEAVRSSLLSHKEFGNCGTEEFFLCEEVEATQSEVQELKNTIDKILLRDGWATVSLVQEALSAAGYSLFERYPYLDNKNAVRATIDYKLSGEYDLLKHVISKKGEHKTVRDVVEDFVEGTEKFLLSDALDYFNERGFNWQFILRYLCESAVRVGEDDLVNKAQIEFDTKSCDDALEAFLVGREYMGIGEVEDFFAFARTAYKWSKFLLEGYLTHFSARYRLVNKFSEKDYGGFAQTKVSGAIVKKESSYKYLGEVLKKLLSDKKFATKEDFSNYLIEKGYILKERKELDALWSGGY